MVTRKGTSSEECGATMIEFAIMLPLYVLFLLILLDIARYFSVQFVLTNAAQVALRSAQTNDSIVFDYYYSNDEQYREMRQVRREIAQEAVQLPNMLLNWVMTGERDRHFDRFLHISDPRDMNDTSEPLPVKILLPGESVIRLGIDEKVSKLQIWKSGWENHPNLCFLKSPNCPTYLKRKKTLPIALLERRYPILVEIKAKFAFLIPGFPSLSLAGYAAGYRERQPQFPDPKEPRVG